MDKELARLFSLGLNENEHLLVSAYYRARWPEGDRSLYFQSNPQNFAGPDGTYPIRTARDVSDAAGLSHLAPDVALMRANLTRIATENGFTDALPAPDMWPLTRADTVLAAREDAGDNGAGGTATNDDEDEAVEASGTDTDTDRTEDAAMGRATMPVDHPAMTGAHSHGHPHLDGYAHGHLHSHNSDNLHDHGHTQLDHTLPLPHQPRSQDAPPLPVPAPIERATLEGFDPTKTLKMYAPIVRSDATRREVFGQATTEKPDAYGTIFGYNPDAWKRWRGNVREQHDPHKAVGRSVNIEYDAVDKSVLVGTRISRGAQDTWLKVEDGVLGGYSVSILPKEQYGLDPRKWPKRLYQGREYPYCPDYDIVELSLVDNPATPGCDIAIVRAGGFTNDEVLDLSESEPTHPEHSRSGVGYVDMQGVWREGEPPEPAMHEMRDHAAHMLFASMRSCECSTCQRAIALFTPDTTGVISFTHLGDPDAIPTQQSERVLTTAIERVLAPIYSRQQAFLSQLARESGQPPNTPPELERSLSAMTARLSTLETTIATIVATLSTQTEDHASLERIMGLVEQIAARPASGGPMLNGAGRADARSNTDRALAEIRRLQQQGVALSPIEQQALAQHLFQPL